MTEKQKIIYPNDHSVSSENSADAIGKNTILSLLLSGICYLYPLLVFMYAARILHPQGLGRTSFAAAVAFFFFPDILFMLFGDYVSFTGFFIYGISFSIEKTLSTVYT